MSDKTGRGVFEARAFTFTGVDGKEYTWIGRGRHSKELKLALESEETKGVTTLKDALVNHRKNKPTGNPVGRPKGSVSSDKNSVKAMAAETVAKADE